MGVWGGCVVVVVVVVVCVGAGGRLEQLVLLLEQLLLNSGRVLCGIGVPGCYLLRPNVCHAPILFHLAPMLLACHAPGCALFIIAGQQCWVL